MITEKINSIFDINECLFFKELGVAGHEYITSNNYYEWYYSLTKEINPESILEIGVRYGYSLCCMALACGKDVYLEGWDSVDTLPLVERDILDIAKENLKNLGYNNFNIITQDSHSVQKMPRKFDLVHIDGDHSYQGKIMDLDLVKNSCKYLIIDDYHHLPQVRMAVDFFMEQNQNIIKEAYIINSFRGTMFVEFLTDELPDLQLVESIQ